MGVQAFKPQPKSNHNRNHTKVNLESSTVSGTEFKIYQVMLRVCQKEGSVEPRSSPAPVSAPGTPLIKTQVLCHAAK